MMKEARTSPKSNEKTQIRENGSRRPLRFLKWLIVTSTVCMWGVLLVAWRFPGELNQPPESPTPTSVPSIGLIGGVVWHDLCDNSSEANSVQQTCVWDSSRDLHMANGILEPGEPRISDVVVSLGIGQCPSKGLATATTGPDGRYTFSGLTAGAYCVWASTTTIHPPAEGNAGVWTTPRTNDGQGVGWKSVILDVGEQLERVDFGWDPLEKPNSGKSETKGDQGSTCTDAATFIKDVTVPDRMSIAPGESFKKVWRLKNTGTCSWTEDYSIVFSVGNRLNASTVSPFSYIVPPGGTTDLAIAMQAPKSKGSYKGYWMLRNASNQQFGIGDKADRPFWVEIVVETKPDRNYVESWEYVLDPEELTSEGRWIDVDVTKQRLTAYEGSTAIKSFLISTGTSAHPTVLGQFRIWIKLEATDMSGPGYHLEDVPYTMYFYQGYGLHGAYWHNNFGTPMSHGCVNLETSNAAWLFDFAAVGTLVNIHP